MTVGEEGLARARECRGGAEGLQQTQIPPGLSPIPRPSPPAPEFWSVPSLLPGQPGQALTLLPRPQHWCIPHSSSGTPSIYIMLYVNAVSIKNKTTSTGPHHPFPRTLQGPHLIYMEIQTPVASTGCRDPSWPSARHASLFAPSRASAPAAPSAQAAPAPHTSQLPHRSLAGPAWATLSRATLSQWPQPLRDHLTVRFRLATFP